MIGVPGAILAQMRTTAEALMTDTCTLYTRQNTRGDAGEVIDGWAITETGIACRMIQESVRNGGEPLKTADQKVLPERYRLVLPHDTVIAQNMRIKLTSDSSLWLVDNVITAQTDQVSVQVMIIPERP